MFDVINYVVAHTFLPIIIPAIYFMTLVVADFLNSELPKNLLPLITLAVSFVTLLVVFIQLRLLRKQLRGEVFKTARVERLYFFIPAKSAYETADYKQEDNELPLDRWVIPLHVHRELYIKVKMAEGQTVRGFSVGFGDAVANKPEVIELSRAFVKKDFNRMPLADYIDWKGVYHCHYVYHRRFAKGDDMVLSIVVKGHSEGTYNLLFTITVDEAPKSWEGCLPVECVGKPNEWAKRYWA